MEFPSCDESLAVCLSDILISKFFVIKFCVRIDLESIRAAMERATNSSAGYLPEPAVSEPWRVR